MTPHQLRHLRFLLVMIAAIIMTGCSTQKNTARSRWWHSFNARYNTYYNGAVAYIDGSLEKENGNRDNFTELLPLYTVGNKGSREIGKAHFDRAIEKSKKAIKQHSIKKRPEWSSNKRKTAKDIEWLNRREYNPFLWKAWILMGRAQFHQGAFEDAASTFAYMARLYHTQPAILGKARAWLAKCYIENGWMYDAEDVIRNMQRDSMDWRAVKEWDYTFADYYIHTKEYDKAIPYLRKVIKHEMRRKQRAREWFLMGQLQRLVGNKEEAYKAYQRVLRQHPPYEMEFNARIAMTEVMSEKNAKQTINRLKRMAASDNNKDYLDQVYYAIGNIYLTQRDTANAIAAYEKGNEKGTRNGIEKGVLLLKLGDLYWLQEKFSDAKRCYGAAIGMLDKDRADYEQLSERSVMLDELVPYTEAVHLQDSLQRLAQMSEKDRNDAIDRVIEALKKKEKEERRNQAEAEAQQRRQQGEWNEADSQSPQPTTTPGRSTTWYFYNPLAISQGKTQFQRLWGKRENVDNWQRSNKTVVGSFDNVGEMTDERRDSIMRAEAIEDSLKNVSDSAQNDPHRREYYLAQIPFTEDQVRESNLIIMDGLHHAGVIFKDKLNNLNLSEKHLRRVTDQYPEYEHMDDVYYHLFLLYSRLGEHHTAENYIARLKAQFPESQWTALLTDPYFKENAVFGTHMEDSLYAATYEAFKANRLSEVAANRRLSDTRFPLGANRDKFIFIGGLSKLNDGDANGCIEDMKTIVKDFPNSRISEMAGMIVNGVNAGKRLRGGRFDLTDVWDRRSLVLNDISDSTEAKTFVPDRDINFAFLLVYHPDSVNENQMLYELARFNFTNYLVRNFDIAIEDIDGISRMSVTGFRSFDEAHLYAQQLYANPNITRLTAKTRGVIISERNLPLLGTNFSYKEYEDFYNKNFAPLKVTELYLLTEPSDIGTDSDPELNDLRTEEPDEKKLQGNENENINNEFIIPEETVTPQNNNNSTIIVPAEPVKTAEPKNNSTIIVPEEPVKTAVPENNGTIIVPTEPVKTAVPENNSTIIVPAEPVKTAEPENNSTIIVPEEPVKTAEPEKPKSTIMPPAEGNSIIVIPEDDRQPLSDDIFIIEEPTGAQKTGTPKKNTNTQTPRQQQNNNEPEIFFEEDLPPVKPSAKTQNKKEKDKENKEKKKQTKKPANELEDEYYELEGF